MCTCSGALSVSQCLQMYGTSYGPQCAGTCSGGQNSGGQCTHNGHCPSCSGGGCASPCGGGNDPGTHPKMTIGMKAIRSRNIPRQPKKTGGPISKLGTGGRARTTGKSNRSVRDRAWCPNGHLPSTPQMCPTGFLHTSNNTWCCPLRDLGPQRNIPVQEKVQRRGGPIRRTIKPIKYDSSPVSNPNPPCCYDPGYWTCTGMTYEFDNYCTAGAVPYPSHAEFNCVTDHNFNQVNPYSGTCRCENPTDCVGSGPGSQWTVPYVPLNPAVPGGEGRGITDQSFGKYRTGGRTTIAGMRNRNNMSKPIPNPNPGYPCTGAGLCPCGNPYDVIGGGFNPWDPSTWCCECTEGQDKRMIPHQSKRTGGHICPDGFTDTDEFGNNIC